jgi:diguanylate cyclase (GGDEF)-like protein
MDEPLHILIVDDSRDDALLVERALGAEFAALRCRHVQTAGGLRHALRSTRWDAVLCDHGVPGLTALDTLAAVRGVAPGTPFLVVSGHTDPDAAALLLRAGASDYVGKDRVERVGPALRRALTARARAATPRATAGAGGASEAAGVLDLVAQAVLVTDAAGTIVHANVAAEALFGAAPGALGGRPLTAHCALPAAGGTGRLAGRGRRPGGDFPLEVQSEPAPPWGPGHRAWTVRDLSHAVVLEERLRREVRAQRAVGAEGDRRAAELRRLVGAMRAGHGLLGWMLAAPDMDTAIWRTCRGLAASPSFGWRAAHAWLIRGAQLVRWDRGGEAGERVPSDGEQPVARVTRAQVPWVDGPAGLVVPLRGRATPLGALELEWRPPGEDPAAAGDRMRAGLREVASAVAGALALTLEIHELLAAERLHARRDPLTGLPNRRALRSALTRELARARRARGRLAVLALDADGLKPVNDAWGHAVGDLVLHALARLLMNGFRVIDMVARTGGDEFVVLMPGVAAAAARQVAERLRRRVERFRFPNPVAPDRAVHLTLSIGVATLRETDCDADAILARADAGCYAAKAAGRNQVAAGEITRPAPSAGR